LNITYITYFDQAEWEFTQVKLTAKGIFLITESVFRSLNSLSHDDPTTSLILF